ncbi:MAG: M23 family metallopeptidase [Oligoflexia bacterium]|nr:M23 family metallopeptidase [Oligoflexia bacterium]
MTTNQDSSPKRRQRLVSFRFLLFILFIAALVPVAFAGWRELYNGFLEHSAPEIVVTQFPRGVGLTPVAVKLRLSDVGAGLDEVVVRTIQKGAAKEILRQSLAGQQSADITIEFPGEKSSLSEGEGELEVKAFDRSFWNNKTVKSFALKIDYRRPKVEVLSTQHNARQGGAQLIIYRATDEALALSGVKVGNNTFLGYPARGLDKDFDDRSLFMALYAIDQNQDPAKTAVRVFAEDEVGNAVSAQFYNKIQPRPVRELNVPMSEDVLLNTISDLAQKNYDQLAEAAKLSGQTLEFDTKKGGKERLLERFGLVNANLRSLSENEISAELKNPRFDRFWFSPMLPQVGGSVQYGYSDVLHYQFEGKEIGATKSNGFEISFARNSDDVEAVYDGIVIFAENIGTYGNIVALDHGLGLVTLYGHLGSIAVHKGESVKAGQQIGYAGRSGLSRNLNVFFQTRVHGIAVDPSEWLDKNWFYAHINAKIDEVKQALGIPILRPVS